MTTYQIHEDGRGNGARTVTLDGGTPLAAVEVWLRLHSGASDFMLIGRKKDDAGADVFEARLRWDDVWDDVTMTRTFRVVAA